MKRRKLLKEPSSPYANVLWLGVGLPRIQLLRNERRWECQQERSQRLDQCVRRDLRWEVFTPIKALSYSRHFSCCMKSAFIRYIIRSALVI